MTEPKPCPFCGNDKKELLSCSGGDDDIVICLDCLAENMRLNCWNTRPIEDALQERIAELEAENEALREAQRWIPVEERLPEEGDIYQVVKQSEAGAYTTHCYYYGNGLWDVMSDQVSHWMNDFPLPDGSK